MARLHTYVPVANVDTDHKAALAYGELFPNAPRFGNVRKLE